MHHDLDEALTYVFEVARERGLAAAPVAGARSPGPSGPWPRWVCCVGRPRHRPPRHGSADDCTRRCATGRRSRTTTTSPTTSTRCCSTSRWPTSCGYFTSDDPSYTVADAQRDKLDLVCRKLGLTDRSAGARPCSTWAAAGVLLVAARRRMIRRAGHGVTIEPSRSGHRQADRPSGPGRSGRVEFATIARSRAASTRSALEMGEARRRDELPDVRRCVAACCTSGWLRARADDVAARAQRRAVPGGGPFIESSIALDTYVRSVGETVALPRGWGLVGP